MAQFQHWPVASEAPNPLVRCDSCNPDSSDTFACLEDANIHFCGRNHRVQANQRTTTAQQQQQHDRRNTWVYVGDLGELSSLKIIRHFATFGPICDVTVVLRPDGSHLLQFVLVQYDSSDTVRKLLRIRRHRIGGKTVAVQQRKSEVRRRLVAIKKDPLHHREVIQQLKSVATASEEEQFKSLVEVLELRTRDMDERLDVCKRLKLVLSLLVSKKGDTICEGVCPFGSSGNGLGFRGCDLDIYVEMVPPGNGGSGDTRKDQQETVNVVAAHLLRHPELAREVLAIPIAKVPIVKLVDAVSGLLCDVNFRNRMPLFNTEFILHCCCEGDPRIRPLLMALRYWAKHFELSEMSNYAFTMMCICYLQQLSMLPSVKDLQKDVLAKDIFGWNVEFSRDPKLLSLSPKNDLSMFQLMRDFFSYYYNFDYDTLLICPFLGKPVPKAAFSSTAAVDMEYYRMNSQKQPGFAPLKVESALCVQDPFELNRCVTENLDDDFVDTFRSRCRETMLLLMEKEISLLSLFSSPVVAAVKAKKPDFPSYREKTSLQWELEFERHFDMDHFFKLVQKLVRLVLVHGLKFEVVKETVGETGYCARRNKMRSKKNPAVFTFMCRASIPTWMGRKKAAMSADTAVGVAAAAGSLEKEALISEHIVRQFSSGFDEWFEIILTKNKEDPVGTVDVRFAMVSSRGNISLLLFPFLADFLPRICLSLLREGDVKNLLK